MKEPFVFVDGTIVEQDGVVGVTPIRTGWEMGEPRMCFEITYRTGGRVLVPSHCLALDHGMKNEQVSSERDRFLDAIGVDLMAVRIKEIQHAHDPL